MSNTTKPQSGRTRHEAEQHDGERVRILATNEVVVLSQQAALALIAQGKAVLLPY